MGRYGVRGHFPHPTSKPNGVARDRNNPLVSKGRLLHYT